jgi:predicted TPR repeat methyltransferase
LAKAALSFKDWPTAAEFYCNLLALYPDYGEAYQSAHAVYHKKLFAYSSDFEVTKQWLERHPEDVATQANFAGAHLTTEHYAESDQSLFVRLPVECAPM